MNQNDSLIITFILYTHMSHMMVYLWYMPRQVQKASEMNHFHWGQFEDHTFHLVFSMGPTFSVVTL